MNIYIRKSQRKHTYLYYSIGLNIHSVPIFVDFIQFGSYFCFIFN